MLQIKVLQLSGAEELAGSADGRWQVKLLGTGVVSGGISCRFRALTPLRP